MKIILKIETIVTWEKEITIAEIDEADTKMEELREDLINALEDIKLLGATTTYRQIYDSEIIGDDEYDEAYDYEVECNSYDHCGDGDEEEEE